MPYKFNYKKYLRLLREIPEVHGAKASIVRLKLTDFIIYSHVELFAGPNVNFIIGPNGIGKSTIVCAICLGLAGKPKLLGRATSLKEYIRRGCNTATIEIELFNPLSVTGMERNYVVKRVIKETSDKEKGLKDREKTTVTSDWYWNARRVPEKEIESHMRELNIQLDNLCQFLPQDKVQEFAKMKPIQLLESTQEAVDGSSGLLSKHKRLVVLQDAIKDLDAHLNRYGENLRIERTHANRLEQDVENFNERKEIIEKIHDFEGKKLWLLYVRAVDEFTVLRQELNEVTAKKNKEEKMLAPLKKEIDNLNKELARTRTTMNTLTSETQDRIEDLRRKYRDAAEDADRDVHSFQHDLKIAEDNEKNRLFRLDQRKERLQGLRNDLESIRERGELDVEGMVTQIQECDRLQTEYSKKIFEITGHDDADRRDISILEEKLREKMREKQAMDDVRIQRMKYVDRTNPDVGKAFKFFFDPANEEYMRTTFQGKIHEPLIFNIFVTEYAFGNVAERHIPRSDQTAFFCENKDDVKTLITEAKKHDWRISCIHHTMPARFVVPRAVPILDQFKRYGFDKVLIDLLQAPDYYMSYLVKQVRPHEILIGNDDTERLTQEIMDETQLTMYYTRKQAVSIKKSFYTGMKNSTMSWLYEAQIFTNKINAVETEAIDNDIKKLQKSIGNLNKNISKRAPALEEWLTQRAQTVDMKKSLQGKINYRNDLLQSITNSEAFLKGIEDEKQDVNKIREELDGKILKTKLRQLDQMERTAEWISIIAQDWRDVFVLKEKVKLLTKCITAKQNQFESSKTNATEYGNAMRGLENKVRAATDATSLHKENARAKTNQQNPPTDVTRKEIDEGTVNREINKLKSHLVCMPVVDDKVIQLYESHQAKIVELESLISDRSYDMTVKKSEMEQLKSEWLGPLEDLIERINDNFGKFFRQMQCVGEVTLDHGEDENNFAKYGVKIKVKFRSHELLQELGTQQSGGEKAITTALYILAIQELTKVPFRVVDEINQGMDAMNETRFFKRLCDLAQGNDTPQYFLISPKMLPPVHYPDNVDVHVVFNGENVFTGLEHEPVEVPEPDFSSDEATSSPEEASESEEESE